MFDIDTLTMSMNYQPVFAGNQTNGNAGLIDEVVDVAGKKSTKVPRTEKEVQDLAKEGEAANTNSTNRLNTVSSPVNAINYSFTTVDPKREGTQRNKFESMFGQNKDSILHNPDLPTDPLMPDLEDTVDTVIFSDAYNDEVEGVVPDFNNLELTTLVSPIPTTRIHNDHPKEKIIRDPLLAPQTRRMTKISQKYAMKIWRLVNLPKGKHAIGTKWVYRNKKDERGIVVRNKASLVTQGYTQEEGINYDEMDVKSAFLYGTIEEELYVYQPPGFEDPHFPDKVYKVEKALYGLHQARRAWIFRYLKGKPELGLWYPRDSPFDLETFLDSDYAGASLGKKSTT
nr:hypothetical protein [Tanacetum cinerariifolium]